MVILVKIPQPPQPPPPQQQLQLLLEYTQHPSNYALTLVGLMKQSCVFCGTKF